MTDQANYLQTTGKGHCLRCHRSFESEIHGHLLECIEGEPTPCTDKCPEEYRTVLKNVGGRPRNCLRCDKPKTQCECGRPRVIDKDVLQKLEDAFANSFTDKEACLYAGIAPTTLYNYQKENPEFVERKEALKLTPNLAAKREIVKGIAGNLDQARWWATNKMGSEFGPKTTVKHEGSIDTSAGGQKQDQLRDEYEEKIKDTIMEENEAIFPRVIKSEEKP